MKLFKSKKTPPQQEIGVQTAPSFSKISHPFHILDTYRPMSDIQMELFRALKEAVPIIDAAITKIVRLVGEFKIISNDEEIEYNLNKFLRDVKVGCCGVGANAFIAAHLNQLLTYGTAVGEIVLGYDGENVEALYNSSLKDVELKTGNTPLKLKICRKKKDGTLKEIKYPELVLISVLNPEPGHIYGESLMKGLPFISGILLKIYNSIGLNWERVGNVRFAVTYKPSKDASDKAFSKERAQQIASEWSKAMKSGGNPSDFIAVGDVDIKVIGADNQVLESQIPVRQMLEQIISKLSLPPFLLGLSWSTTETMSTQQAEILGNELDAYRRLLNPIIQKICDIWLKVNGYYSDYKISWEKIDLKDNVHIANARLIEAQAREIEKRLEEN